MPDSLKEVVTQAWNRDIIVAKQYICEDGKSKSGVCRECEKYRDKIYVWPDDAEKMPQLPIHPNCLCHYKDLTLSDVRTCAWKEKQKILEITADENKFQAQNDYSIFNACAIQADELASRLYSAHFIFWYFKVLRGASIKYQAIQKFYQHHVVSVHPIPPNPLESFILDTWNGRFKDIVKRTKDISGNTTVRKWKKLEYPYDHYEIPSNQEILDVLNTDPKKAEQMIRQLEKIVK